MTNQEVFDIIVKGLRKQGKPSLSETEGMCLYRGPSNSKCAVGLLIKDSEYTPKMEGKSLYSIMNSYSSLDRFRPNESLLEAMQKLHDTSAINNSLWLEHMEAGYNWVAERFNLVVPQLETIEP